MLHTYNPRPLLVLLSHSLATSKTPSYLSVYTNKRFISTETKKTVRDFEHLRKERWRTYLNLTQKKIFWAMKVWKRIIYYLKVKERCSGRLHFNRRICCGVSSGYFKHSTIYARRERNRCELRVLTAKFSIPLSGAV